MDLMDIESQTPLSERYKANNLKKTLDLLCQ